MYVDLCQCADRLGCVRVGAERSVSGRYGPFRADLGLCEIVRVNSGRYGSIVC